MSDAYRIVAVRKDEVTLKQGELVRWNKRLQAAVTTTHDKETADPNDADDPGVENGLCGIVAADAAKSAFTVDVRIPKPQAADLIVVQTAATGRKTADERPIVEPVVMYRKFKADDDPKRDRHPVLFLREREHVRDGAAGDATDAVAGDAAATKTKTRGSSK